MNFKIMGRFIAQILTIEGVFMIPAALLCVYYQEASALYGFLIAMAAIAVTASLLFALCRKAPSALDAREGMVCVGISWIVLSLFGCLPFFLSREIPRYIDAFFEIVSGFTTTGSSILTDVEALSKGLIYWRSCVSSGHRPRRQRYRLYHASASGGKPRSKRWKAGSPDAQDRTDFILNLHCHDRPEHHFPDCR